MSEAAYRFNNELRYRPGDHDRQVQLTPAYVLEPARMALGGEIALDPCTEPDNPTGATAWHTAEEDGLSVPWDAPSIWVNPPYGKAREPWIERCILAAREGRRVLLLIPAHTETKPFQRAASTADVVVFVRARLRFTLVRENGRKAAASHGSALLGWNVDVEPLRPLGLVLEPGGSGDAA